MSAYLLAIVAVTLGAPDLDTFLDTFAEKRKEVDVLSVRFVQETITPDETLLSYGQLTYLKPRRIVFHFEEPEVYYIVTGDRLLHYDVELEQVQIYSVEDDPAASAIFLGLDADLRRLHDAYDMELIDAGDVEGASAAIALEPKPRADEGEPLFLRAQLFLRETDYLPIFIYINTDDEGQVALRMDTYDVNGVVETSETEVFLPPGVKIIEDDKLVEKVGEEGKRISLVDDSPGEPETP